MTARVAAALAAFAPLLACELEPHDMDVQPRFDPYEATDLFPDGRVMRHPPPGTVPRERPILPEPVRTGREGGRELERVPIPVTRELVLRGRHAFEIRCAACHGLIGDGNSLVARNMSLVRPPSLLDIPGLRPGHVFTVVTEGFGLMPSYAADVPVEERWGIAAYVEALRRSQRAPLERAPPEIRRALEEAPR